MHDPALALDGLRKGFGETLAVDDLSMSVAPGAFFGLVGPNGAGKTTALSMTVGLLRPDAGSARVLGADVGPIPTAPRRCWACPDGLALPQRLTGPELLTYLGM